MRTIFHTTTLIEMTARELAVLDGVNPDWSASGMGMPGPQDNDPGWKMYEEDAAAMSDLDRKAFVYAARAHDSAGQVRKYTGQPYMVHPTEVARIVRSVPHTHEMVAAAYLHDTVEDTRATLTEIERYFGDVVATLVYWLTDVSRPEDGNRAARKAIDRAHLASAPAAAQTIKLADLIDNSRSIKKHDRDFWETYRREKLQLLDVLTEGDPTLWTRARKLCE